MLKSLLSTAAVVLLCVACSEDVTPTRTVEAPKTGERAAAEAVNEVDQAIAPDEQFTADELARGVSASSVTAPATTFSTSIVKTRGGDALGEVRSVNVGPSDRAASINVEVGGFLGMDEHVVTIDASRLTYLADRNVLVADISKDEVAKLPVRENVN